MSRARLRARVRAGTGPWSPGPDSAGDAAEVGRVAGVDLDLLARRDEQGHVDRGTGLDRCGLGAAGGAVALEPGLGVGHLELDRGRELDVEDAALVGGHDRLL